MRQSAALQVVSALVASTVVAGWCARSAVQLAAQPAAQSAAPPAAQGLVRVVRNQPGESKALDVTADEVATWTEAGKRILLLKGNVWVEMGIVYARFSQGVIWVDLVRF